MLTWYGLAALPAEHLGVIFDGTFMSWTRQRTRVIVSPRMELSRLVSPPLAVPCLTYGTR